MALAFRPGLESPAALKFKELATREISAQGLESANTVVS
jgi:hypothetical protein